MALICLFSNDLKAQSLFSEDFEDQQAASRFDIVQTGTSNVSDLAFKYGSLTAPDEGGTYCAKLAVNTSESAASFVGLFPKGQTFTGTYKISFDVWLNWAGASGTTEFLRYGVGHAGTGDLPSDGVDFCFTNDNGATNDKRIYKDGVELDINAAVYSDNTQMQSDTHNTSLIDDDDDPSTFAHPGNQWLKASIEVTESAVIYSVNGFEWARLEEKPADGNILIGYWDMWSSVGSADVYALIDNIEVEQTTATAIDNVAMDNVKVYPNPATDILNVVVEEASNFELYNTSGKLIKKQRVEGRTTVTVSDLSTGLYIARIINAAGQVKTVKVQVN